MDPANEKLQILGKSFDLHNPDVDWLGDYPSYVDKYIKEKVNPKKENQEQSSNTSVANSNQSRTPDNEYDNQLKFNYDE